MTECLLLESGCDREASREEGRWEPWSCPVSGCLQTSARKGKDYSQASLRHAPGTSSIGRYSKLSAPSSHEIQRGLQAQLVDESVRVLLERGGLGRLTIDFAEAVT